ncbi:MAG: 30S ribosomal protein S27ae [Candidatus Aenigmarchaeota archaeon]|nr:30S ribosomal protein S27ae [Candidatus Aenigmarchaeota archaeon]
MKVSKFFEVKEGKLRRIGRVCNRCGDTFMAAHKQADGKTRYYCGKCHLTIWE